MCATLASEYRHYLYNIGYSSSFFMRSSECHPIRPSPHSLHNIGNSSSFFVSWGQLNVTLCHRVLLGYVCYTLPMKFCYYMHNIGYSRTSTYFGVKNLIFLSSWLVWLFLIILFLYCHGFQIIITTYSLQHLVSCRKFYFCSQRQVYLLLFSNVWFSFSFLITFPGQMYDYYSLWWCFPLTISSRTVDYYY